MTKPSLRQIHPTIVDSGQGHYLRGNSGDVPAACSGVDLSTAVRDRSFRFDSNAHNVRFLDSHLYRSLVRHHATKFRGGSRFSLEKPPELRGDSVHAPDHREDSVSQGVHRRLRGYSGFKVRGHAPIYFTDHAKIPDSRFSTVACMPAG